MIYDTTFIRFMHSLKSNNKTPIRFSLSRIRRWYHKQGACYRLLVEFHPEARGKQSCNSWSRRWFVISLYEYFKCANSRAITGDDWASYFILCRRESSCRPAEGHIRWFHNTEGSQTPLTFKQILFTKILMVFSFTDLRYTVAFGLWHWCKDLDCKRRRDSSSFERLCV